jgi:hypothetical protein
MLYGYRVTYLGSQEIVGSSDGMDVPCQVKVEVIHGDHLNFQNYKQLLLMCFLKLHFVKGRCLQQDCS